MLISNVIDIISMLACTYIAVCYVLFSYSLIYVNYMSPYNIETIVRFLLIVYNVLASIFHIIIQYPIYKISLYKILYYINKKYSSNYLLLLLIILIKIYLLDLFIFILNNNLKNNIAYIVFYTFIGIKTIYPIIFLNILYQIADIYNNLYMQENNKIRKIDRGQYYIRNINSMC